MNLNGRVTKLEQVITPSVKSDILESYPDVESWLNDAGPQPSPERLYDATWLRAVNSYYPSDSQYGQELYSLVLTIIVKRATLAGHIMPTNRSEFREWLISVIENDDLSYILEHNAAVAWRVCKGEQISYIGECYPLPEGVR